MSIEQAVVRFVELYLVTFALVAVLFLAVGVLIGYWVAKDQVRRGGRREHGDGLLNVAYSVGVAKAGDPFSERCEHGVRFLDECLDCPDGCPQVVA